MILWIAGSPSLPVFLVSPSSPVLLGSPRQVAVHYLFIMKFLPTYIYTNTYMRQVAVPHTFQFPSYNQFSWVFPVFPQFTSSPGIARQVDMQTVICSRFEAVIFSSNQFSWVLQVYQYSLIHPIYQFSWVPTAYLFSWVLPTSYSFTHISMICRPASVLVL